LPRPRPSGFSRVKRNFATGPMRHVRVASASARCRLGDAPGGGFRPICGGPVACGSRPSSQLDSDFARHPRPLRLRLRSLAPPRPLQFMLPKRLSSNPRNDEREPFHWPSAAQLDNHKSDNPFASSLRPLRLGVKHAASSALPAPPREIFRWLCRVSVRVA
jgi:hypothetical protein